MTNTKPMYAMPYYEAFGCKNISSRVSFVRMWLLSQLSPILSVEEATGNGLFFGQHIFYAHVLYREVLVSLEILFLSLVISRNKVSLRLLY